MKETEDRARTLIRNSELVLSELTKGEKNQGEVFATHNTDFKVVFENNDFSVSTSNSTAMYGIRCISQGRLGFMTTNSESESMLKEAAKEVQLVARLSPPSENHQIASEPNGFGHFEAIDPKVKRLGPKELYSFAQNLVDEALSDPRVIIERAEFGWTDSHRSLINTNGFAQSAGSVYCSWFLMGIAKQGDQITSFDFDGASSRFESDIQELIQSSVGRFKESVLGSLGASKGKSYRGKVLLCPEAVMDLVGGFISSNCNGLRHQDGMSSWKSRKGELVASPSLLVFQDPLNAGRIEDWSPFDREGTVTQRQNLIEDGRLNFIAHNCFSAHREGVVSTGNAVGTAKSLPQVGFFNLGIGGSHVKANLSTEASMLKELGTGLVLKRFSGNDDPTSGSFSGVAKNSWWVEGGRKSHPVNEIMVAGNLFELLKSILMIGNEQHPILGGGLAPFILVDGLTITTG